MTETCDSHVSILPKLIARFMYSMRAGSNPAVPIPLRHVHMMRGTLHVTGIVRSEGSSREGEEQWR